MKKPVNNKITAAKIVAGVIASLTIGANITGCVYGPPVEEPSDNTDITKTEETETAIVTVDPSEEAIVTLEEFDATYNEVPCVYGPPEVFEETADESN